jgi:ABC-type multidrug transport system fused ATPase/permease subunit
VSIAENVAFSNMDEDRVISCLKLAGLWDKISSLPNGIKSKLIKSVNGDATDLSGGEQQKLALARAIYKNAPILILDEPTAALDPIAENEVYMQYNDLARNKTAVYISHRLSSTRFCDRIAFLENGEIRELGSHDALMKQNGLYARMFAVQSHYYQEELEEVGCF